jgi:hypothetical protein
MGDMRVCGAAIIHVDADKTITDTGGNEHVLLNPNVLIEVGAAMAEIDSRLPQGGLILGCLHEIAGGLAGRRPWCGRPLPG